MGGRGSDGGEGGPSGGEGGGPSGGGGGGGASGSGGTSRAAGGPAPRSLPHRHRRLRPRRMRPATTASGEPAPAWGRDLGPAGVAAKAERAAAPSIEVAQEAMSRADAAMRRAQEVAGSALGGEPPVAADSCRHGVSTGGTGSTAASTAPAAPTINRDTTVNAAAQRLARDLRAIPGIERFGALRLGELDRAGPRPLRTMWRIARDELGEQYGEMTIGEVLDRYGRGGGAPGAQA